MLDYDVRLVGRVKVLGGGVVEEDVGDPEAVGREAGLVDAAKVGLIGKIYVMCEKIGCRKGKYRFRTLFHRRFSSAHLRFSHISVFKT